MHGAGVAHLNAGVADVADLLTVELLPLLIVEALGDGYDEVWADNVDEGVANIALVLEVDGQVEEVEHAGEALIDCSQQHLLIVLVGDVLDHQCGPWVLACICQHPGES